jgi:SAM-dependent methyltransferase
VTAVFDRQFEQVLPDARALEHKLCSACGKGGLSGFFAVRNVPVHQNLLHPTRGEAENCKRGELNLGFCRHCGFIANYGFDPSLLSYSQEYENTQSRSMVFQSYMNTIAQHLIERYDLKDKSVLEIGCGKGDFLKTICRLGNNRGFGFDTTYVESDNSPDLKVQFIQGYYSPQYARYQGDLVCCRHVLEHIGNPLKFLSMVRETIGDNLGTVVFFEVPCLRWILKNRAFWDLFYEHCNYFSDIALANLFRLSGFRVNSVSTNFHDQYLWLEATPEGAASLATAQQADNIEDLASSVENFRAQIRERMILVRSQLLSRLSSGERVALWGAGAKGVTILNTLQLTCAEIPFVVDINPGKQQMYVPGTGQKVVPPEDMVDFNPDAILVMNPAYHLEIEAQVKALGLSCELLSI